MKKEKLLRISDVVKKLEKIRAKEGDIECLVDLDEDGYYYNLEKVKAVNEGAKFCRRKVVNFISSNKAYNGHL